MRNVKSTLKLIGQYGLAAIALAIFSTTSFAAPTAGSPVKDQQGQIIGTVKAPLESDAKLSPSYIIELNCGTKQVACAPSLQEQGDSVVLSATTPAATVDNPELTELRSMTMVMVMQSHEDAGMLKDISEMNYRLNGETLIITGSIDSVISLQRLLTATSELCDYQIAPNITIRPKIAG